MEYKCAFQKNDTVFFDKNCLIVEMSRSKFCVSSDLYIDISDNPPKCLWKYDWVLPHGFKPHISKAFFIYWSVLFLELISWYDSFTIWKSSSLLIC